MSNKEKESSKLIKITLTYDPTKDKVKQDGKERSMFTIDFHPNIQDLNTNIRQHLVVLANGFYHGVKQLVSVIHPLPQPTTKEFETLTYNFKDHEKEYQDNFKTKDSKEQLNLFGLYQYKKALMEELAYIVEPTLNDAFHDVLFVKGAQEKIFEELRQRKFRNKESEGVPVEEEKDNKKEGVKDVNRK